MDDGYGRWSTFFSAIFELLFDLVYFVNAKWALITLPKTLLLVVRGFPCFCNSRRGHS